MITRRVCRRDFVSDGSPAAVQGYCLHCRTGVAGDCRGCGGPTRSGNDGEWRCTACRQAAYEKDYLYNDPTGSRLWRLRIGKDGLEATW